MHALFKTTGSSSRPRLLVIAFAIAASSPLNADTPQPAKSCMVETSLRPVIASTSKWEPNERSDFSYLSPCAGVPKRGIHVVAQPKSGLLQRVSITANTPIESLVNSANYRDLLESNNYLSAVLGMFRSTRAVQPGMKQFESPSEPPLGGIVAKGVALRIPVVQYGWSDAPVQVIEESGKTTMLRPNQGILNIPKVSSDFHIKQNTLEAHFEVIDPKTDEELQADLAAVGPDDGTPVQRLLLVSAYAKHQYMMNAISLYEKP